MDVQKEFHCFTLCISLLGIFWRCGRERSGITDFFLNFYLLILAERRTEEGGEGKHQLVVPLIYAFIDCFLFVS